MAKLRKKSPGSFEDLEQLLEQLGTPPVIELGKPLPKEKHLPRPPAARCPAAHNRFLLDGSDEPAGGGG